MNTISIAQDVQFVETSTVVTYTDADLFLPETAATREFRTGWQLFTDGGFLIDCTNNDQRRGWQAAERMALLAAAEPMQAVDGAAPGGADGGRPPAGDDGLDPNDPGPASEDDYEWLRVYMGG